jgi:hypothetical protein
MSDETFHNELVNPHCGNQALHLAEYCLVTIRTFDTVLSNITDPRLIMTGDIADKAGEDLTGICLRMVVTACDGDRAMAVQVMGDAVEHGITLHESIMNYRNSVTY